MTDVDREESVVERGQLAAGVLVALGCCDVSLLGGVVPVGRGRVAVLGGVVAVTGQVVAPLGGTSGLGHTCGTPGCGRCTGRARP
jgi:hypothetical protein